MNLFRTNDPLIDTIVHDQALTDSDKKLFLYLCDPDPEPDSAAEATQEVINIFAKLFLRNYVWIEGLNGGCAAQPPIAHDRSKWANRKRALRALFTGDFEQ